jgi:hypothetical protein
MLRLQFCIIDLMQETSGALLRPLSTFRFWVRIESTDLQCDSARMPQSTAPHLIISFFRVPGSGGGLGPRWPRESWSQAEVRAARFPGGFNLFRCPHIRLRKFHPFSRAGNLPLVPLR